MTGVNTIGAFAVSSPYDWDPSNLYTTGEVTLLDVPEPMSLFPVMVSAVGYIYRRQSAI